MSDANRFTGAGAHAKSWSERAVMRDRDYPDHALVLVTRGGGFYEDAAGRHEVRTGNVVAVFPGLRHGYGPLPGSDWEEIWLAFRGPLFAELERDGLLDRRRPLLALAPSPAVTDAFRRLLGDFARPAGTRPASFVARLHLLIAELDERWARVGAASADPPWLERACRRLDEDPARPLDLAALARELALDYGAFRKRFVRALGVPPARYRQLRRIDRAKTLLAGGDAPLAAIAAELGYCDVYFFSRQFRQVVGRSPGAWRRLHRGA